MADGSIGMMDEAYFVGRREIILWINETLQLNISKIEQTANGCVAIQMLDMLHPGLLLFSWPTPFTNIFVYFGDRYGRYS